jgi:UDP-N-acetylmuramoyl-L-alanyl-D-glutamate--2,6-diaminopimelate ligase
MHEVGGAHAPQLRVTSCSSDWRQVRPGDVFVAIVDADEDGHDSAHLAVRRGAAAVICERRLPVFDVPQCVVPCSRTVYGRLCQALMGEPSRLVKVIGVTGTHGKTTVARLVSSILRDAGAAVGTLDSFGYWDGWDDRPPLDGPLTPPVLARSLAEMAAAGATHAVVELASRELSVHAAAGVTLDAACITHVDRNHLAWHGSVENYRQAKRRIFDYLQHEGVAILNADDSVSMRMLSELQHPALTFALQKPAEVTAEIIEQQVNEQLFVMTTGDESVGVRTAIVGDHHIYNCLAAATIALAYGVELTNIARGLEAVDSLPGRMERVMCGQDFAVFVDAADSPAALRACLQAARRVTRGRLICVFGAPGDGDSNDWSAMGRVVGAMADAAVVTENGRHDASSGACQQLVGGFADRRKTRIMRDRAAAIAWALDEAEAGDSVVIAGRRDCGHTWGDGAEMRLNDSAIVRRALCERASWRPQEKTAA